MCSECGFYPCTPRCPNAPDHYPDPEYSLDDDDAYYDDSDDDEVQDDDYYDEEDGPPDDCPYRGETLEQLWADIDALLHSKYIV